jgi:hypothetical protein
VLTKIGESKEKTAGLISVNLDTGEADREITINNKEPDYHVDEAEGHVYNVRNKKELIAISAD